MLLFLSFFHSFLGFERTNKTRDPDRFLISFADVEAISKVESYLKYGYCWSQR